MSRQTFVSPTFSENARSVVSQQNTKGICLRFPGHIQHQHHAQCGGLHRKGFRPAFWGGFLCLGTGRGTVFSCFFLRWFHFLNLYPNLGRRRANFSNEYVSNGLKLKLVCIVCFLFGNMFFVSFFLVEYDNEFGGVSGKNA